MADDSVGEKVTYGSGGKVMGALAVVVALAAVGFAVFDREGRPAFEVISAAIFLGTLAWASMLRPQLTIDGSVLVLRNMLETITVPLAAIEHLTVRQVLVVVAGDRKITSSAIGRSRRQIMRDGRGGAPISAFGTLLAGGREYGGPDTPPPEASSYGLMVEGQLRARVENAREAAGVKRRSAEQAALADGVERRPAVVEIAVLAVSGIAFVVLLFV